MLYFLTHPQAEIDPGVAVTAWPLSPEGRRRLEAVRTAAAFDSITQVWASSERKAVETARLLTHGRPIETMICPELGENDRSSTGYLPREQFERHADRFFVYPTANRSRFEQLPASCAEAADALEDSRAAFEELGVFPQELIDAVLDELRGHDDAKLHKRLAKDDEAREELVCKHWHVG